MYNYRKKFEVYTTMHTTLHTFLKKHTNFNTFIMKFIYNHEYRKYNQ